MLQTSTYQVCLVGIGVRIAYTNLTLPHPRGKAHHGPIVTFSHPDYTVGPGIAPDLSTHHLIKVVSNSRARHVYRVPIPYRRSGIAPCPEGLQREVWHIFTLNASM